MSSKKSGKKGLVIILFLIIIFFIAAFLMFGRKSDVPATDGTDNEITSQQEITTQENTTQDITEESQGNTETFVESTTQAVTENLFSDTPVVEVTEETTEEETTSEPESTTEQEITTENNYVIGDTVEYVSGDTVEIVGDRPVERKVYATPTGKRYHYDAECGGKNSFEITMDEIGSRTACQKCAS